MAPLETWEVVEEVQKGAHLVGVVSTFWPAEGYSQPSPTLYLSCTLLLAHCQRQATHLIFARSSASHLSHLHQQGSFSPNPVKQAWREAITYKLPSVADETNHLAADRTIVWKGGNSDHTPDVKKLYRLGSKWKRESSRILLGYDKLQRMEPAKLVNIVCNILKSNLHEVGGEAQWAKFSNQEKNTRTKSLMDTLAFCLGKEVFETLPEKCKQEIELFFWAGCSMHKELNCCKAFDNRMKKFYNDHPELDQPVLLANKDNNTTIQLAEDTGESTAVDDKKGLHNVYENYFWPTISTSVCFPDISNTRYQSHRQGGARIITYLEEHREFMVFVKDNKQKQMLNHLEENIVKGLHCPQTISQIITLVLFCMAVMHPYTLHVRAPGTENLNMLDLGPYHASVKAHMKKLIADPGPLFSSSPNSYKITMLDGRPWSDTKAWDACIK
ncbi:hypothetical protein DFH08DRAFT_962310 [Mycena albidolilacea]|uniref:Uncharacterized protein n=1 Tax=Mycena albidolilacea TaxID=1033008 RepID=A0AAD7ENR5_9AGAR|nr:hypothetical protein DFH08DRAFT_962310 [Mycena albidolilacea]